MADGGRFGRRALDSLRRIVSLLTATYEAWRSDRAIRLGAALAYYAIFAVVPLVSSAIAIAGIVFSETDIRNFLTERLESGVSEELAGAVEELASTIDTSSTIGGLTALGLVSGVFAASLVFVAFQDSMNMVWHLPVQRGLRQSLRRRVLAFLIVLLAAGVLIAAVLVQGIVVLVDERVLSQTDLGELANELIVTGATWVLGVAAIALLYQLLTRQALPWLQVAVAASVTVFLMIVGTWAVGVYFDVFGSASLTGAAGAVLVLLIWLYYQAQILIGGAELLKTMVDRSGSGSP